MGSRDNVGATRVQTVFVLLVGEEKLAEVFDLKGRAVFASAQCHFEFRVIVSLENEIVPKEN